MANIIYNAGNADLHKAANAWDSSATYKALLVRDTSTYVPDKDHATLAAMAGLVEISVPSYTRKDVTLRTVSVDNSTDEVMLDCADIDFGVLETGQTVKAIIIYRHVTADADSVPLCYIDTDTVPLLPRALGGGQFKVQINALGLIRSKQQ
ncbi:MAG: hypothetical protein KatS3mg038_2596 [Candidatus Kapaibacterium sp.]|nr:MAG: hypothetical protein KatS3mg038_2596 [Candidatus Kapabacteria bacterium]